MELGKTIPNEVIQTQKGKHGMYSLIVDIRHKAKDNQPTVHKQREDGWKKKENTKVKLSQEVPQDIERRASFIFHTRYWKDCCKKCVSNHLHSCLLQSH